MKSFYICTFLLLSLVGVSQENSLNSYKYVIVPTNFNIFNEADAYQMNSLTKFLFEKYGYTAVFENSEYPIDLAANNCLALKADLIENSSLIRTKLKVALKDCRNTTIYTSFEGESKDKDLKTAYHAALREAFNSIESLNYKFKPSTDSETLKKAKAQAKPVKDITTQIDQRPSDTVATRKNSVVSETVVKFAITTTSNGFVLSDERSKEILGTAYSTAKEGVYLFRTAGSIGVAYFATDGNFMVEFLEEDGSIIKKEFQF